MSFLAWDVKAPRGFGRLRGYTAPLPGLPPGSYTGSTSTTVERAMSATVASVAPMVVDRTVTGPAYQVSVSAPTLEPRYAPTVRTRDDMVAQIDRAGSNVADQSMGASDATRAGRSSADEAVGIPPGTVVDAPDGSGTPFIVPPDAPQAPRTIPWWVYFAGGAVGGGLLAALLSR